LTASTVGEHAIAGMTEACTAGAAVINAPARVMGAEEEFFPLRLRGGSDEPGTSSKGAAGIPSTAALLQDEPRRRGALSPSSDEATPGPSGTRRSRSKNRPGVKTAKKSMAQKWARQIKRRLRKKNSTASSDEDESGTRDDSKSERETLKPEDRIGGSPVKPDQGGTKRPQTGDPIVITSEDSEGRASPERGKGEEGKMMPPPPRKDGYSSSEDTVVAAPLETPPPKKKMLGPKSKRAKGGPIDEITDNWTVPEKRGRGRPPTTGEYQKLAEAKKAANDERERENRLAMESKVYSMEETLKILRKAKMDPEDVADQQKLAPTGDVASKVREAAAEVVRIAKISSNLQGPLQRALKVAASNIMGLTDILRTRADGTAELTGSEELRQLREQIAELQKEHEKMGATIQTLRDDVAKAREEAETAKRKANVARQELLNSSQKNEELRRRLREEREKIEAVKRHTPPAQPRREEPMEVDPTPPTWEKEETPPPRRIMPTAQELKNFPALRPPRKGKREPIPERPLPPPEREEDYEEKRISKGRKKGTRGPAWDQMEAFSSIMTDPKEFQRETAREVVVLLDEVARRHMGGDSILQPARAKQQTRDKSTARRGELANPPQAKSAIPQKRGPTEARKARKREKRRLKRQEEARRRAEGHQGPTSGLKKAQRPRPTAEEGPASRTRSRTRSGARTVTGATADAPWARPNKPPAEEIPIRDVPIPPDDWVPDDEWTPVTGRRGRRQGQSRSRGQNTYAGVAAKAPPPPRRGRTSSMNRQRVGERGTDKGVRQQQPARPQIKKPPKTAAVQVTCPPGTYAETMRAARERVDLRGLGIGELRPRRARTGALLLEIPGGDGAARAETLTRELREALRDREGVIITRPIKTAELRIKDLEDSVSAVDIAVAIAKTGQCEQEEVRVGAIRMAPNRLGTAWCRCPLTAANRIAKEGKLVVGWTKVRVEILPDRPTTCFRCLRRGHVRANCPEDGGNEGLCYRCGEPGHLAGTCAAPPRCPLCKGSGRPENHRVGSEACRAPKRGNNRRANPITDRTTTRPTTPRPVQHASPIREPTRPDTITEPMDIDPPRLTPSPPAQPQEWPTTGERWSQERPLPSRREAPITGEGPKPSSPAPLPPSRPEPITGGERLLNRRRRLVPVFVREKTEAPGAPIIPSIPPPPPSYVTQIQERLEGMKAVCGELEWELREFSSESEIEKEGATDGETQDPHPPEEPANRTEEREKEEKGPPASADVGAQSITDSAQTERFEDVEAPPRPAEVPNEDGCPDNNQWGATASF